MTTDTPSAFDPPSMINLVGVGMTRDAARQVYEQAGIGPGDIQVCELHDCFAQNELITYEGLGLMKELPYERAMIAIGAAATMHRAYELTVEYVRERKVFGKPIVDFQNTRFTLAEIKATVLASRLFADYIVQKWIDGSLDSATAAMGKVWLTDRQCEVIDRCLQFFGGFGYMMEYPIARMYVDARVQRIYGGSNEIQKELVGRDL